MGVISLIDFISKPSACKARMADSLPAPGPFILTSTYLTPNSLALAEASLAANWAAKGVPLRAPLNPAVPALAQQTVFPCWSLMVIMVSVSYTHLRAHET